MAFKYPKYKNLFSLAKKNKFLYKKITPILMVKILDFNCVRNLLTKSYCVYVFFDLHFFITIIISFYFNLHDVHNLHIPKCFVLYVQLFSKQGGLFLLLKIQVLNNYVLVVQ